MKLADFVLSEYGSASSIPAPVNRMMAAFAADFRQDKDINVGVGYVNERTIPHDLISEALQAVIAHPEKYKVALNYGGSQGSPNLIDSIKKFHVENGIGGLTQELLDRNEIIIGPNSATSLLFLNGTKELLELEKDLIEFIDKQVIDSLVYELYFKEKFEDDGMKTNLLGLVEPYLKDIDALKSDEEKLQAIKEVVDGIKSDGAIMSEIQSIKNQEWVKIIEGGEE